jgi:hypothetical protein
MEATNNLEENDDSLSIDDLHNSMNFDKKLLDVDHKVRLFYDKSTSQSSKSFINQRQAEKMNNDESIDTFMLLSFFENTKNSDIDLKSIKLIQKQSLIDLISRNREHGILVILKCFNFYFFYRNSLLRLILRYTHYINASLDSSKSSL